MKHLYCILFFLISIDSIAQNMQYQKLVDEGLQFLDQKNIADAIDKYQQAFKIDSNKVEANYGLGVAYQYYCQTQGKDCLLALYYIEKAIKIDDTYRNCYYSRAGIKTLLKDYKGAIKDFNKAILKSPEKAHYYVGRATTYLKLDMREDACKDLKKAADLNSEIAKALLISQGCN